MDLNKVLENRHGKEEAKRVKEEMLTEINEILEEGGNYDEIEEFLLNEDLEMDYLMDLI